MRGRNPHAREKLIKTNLRLVINNAKHYENHGVTLLDIIREDNIGTDTSRRKIGSSLSFRFFVYAARHFSDSEKIIRFFPNRDNP